jgi:hypothetical protein
MFAKKFGHIANKIHDHVITFLQGDGAGWWWRFLLLDCQKIAPDILKNPGIPQATPTDHDPVTAGFKVHPRRILNAENVAVANDWNGQVRLQLGNQASVGLAGKLHRPGPGVDGKRGYSFGLGNFANLQGIDLVVVPAGPNFYGYRQFRGLGHGSKNLGTEFGLAHKRRPRTTFNDFFYRTTHVEVNQLATVGLDVGGGVAEGNRIGPKNLERKQLIRQILMEHIQSFTIMPIYPGGTNHFRAGQATAKALDQSPEWGIADAGHRRQNEIIREGESSLLQNSSFPVCHD